MGQHDATASPPDLSALREELLAAVASIFDKAVDAAWRQGAEAAARAAAQAALNSVAGATIGSHLHPPDSLANAGPPPIARPLAQAALLPESVPTARAPSGAVQDGVLAVLQRSARPLAPLRIVDAGKEMGLALKASSVRMALIALSKRGRVEQDARGDYQLVPPRATLGAAPFTAEEGGKTDDRSRSA